MKKYWKNEFKIAMRHDKDLIRELKEKVHTERESAGDGLLLKMTQTHLRALKLAYKVRNKMKSLSEYDNLTEILEDSVNFRVLTPLTGEPDEWEREPDENGEIHNVRDPNVVVRLEPGETEPSYYEYWRCTAHDKIVGSSGLLDPVATEIENMLYPVQFPYNPSSSSKTMVVETHWINGTSWEKMAIDAADDRYGPYQGVMKVEALVSKTGTVMIDRYFLFTVSNNACSANEITKSEYTKLKRVPKHEDNKE